MAARCGGQICRPFVLGFGNWQAVERDGEEGKFPGPRDVWGPRRSKILNNVFQIASFWPPQICIKSIFGRGSARDAVALWADRAPAAPIDQFKT